MIPGLPNTLSAIADFLECQQRFAAVEGFLADLEGYTLMQLAAGGPGLGAIVEIGSFMGRSTAFLAAGAAAFVALVVFALRMPETAERETPQPQ